MHVSDEEMIRALVVSNLISIHLKTGSVRFPRTAEQPVQHAVRQQESAI